MSFRLFIYYCALCGGWSGLAGWLIGRVVSRDILDEGGARIRQAGIRGLFLGLMVALGLSLVDALWNLSWRRRGQIAARVGVATLVGAVGGLLGGMLGQWLLGLHEVLFVFGWRLTGLLVGG